VHNRRDVMVVGARADESRKALGGILAGKLPHVLHELELAHGRGNLELALEPDSFGDIAEELLDRLDAYRLQHLLPILVGVG